MPAVFFRSDWKQEENGTRNWVQQRGEEPAVAGLARNDRGRVMRNGFLLAAALLTFLTPAAYSEMVSGPEASASLSQGTVARVVEDLRERLGADGHRTDFLDDPRFAIHVQTPRLIRRENKADFFAPSFGIFTERSFRRARVFMNEHSGFLERAEKEYGVWREYITTILLVESGFGKIKRPHRVINGLASMYASGRAWAYREITTLIGLQGILYDDIFDLRGSHAGAFGLAQMIPTSYKTFGVDFDADGRIDPDSPADAIGSVANYLKKCGFGASPERRWNSVFAYNRQKSYTDAITAFALRIREEMAPEIAVPEKPADRVPAP